MPHYADGTEAKPGDHVTGKMFNTDGVRAGTIISITPGVESCNAMVQFTELRPLASDVNVAASVRPRMAVDRAVLVRSEQHGGSGPYAVLYVCADYCDTKNLTKVG